MEITAEHFRKAVGRDPIQDDLERSNCPQAGELGHHFCGWDHDKDLPVFMVGREVKPSQPNQRLKLKPLPKFEG